MKKTILLLVLSILVFSLAVDAQLYRAKNWAKPAEQPAFTLQLPRNNVDIIGDTLTVQVFSPNTIIRKTPLKNKPQQGHLKITINKEKPVYVYMATHRLNIANLPTATHKLTVELVQNDHTSFNPPVEKKIQFNVQRTALKAGKQAKKPIVRPGRIFYYGRI